MIKRSMIKRSQWGHEERHAPISMQNDSTSGMWQIHMTGEEVVALQDYINAYVREKQVRMTHSQLFEAIFHALKSTIVDFEETSYDEEQGIVEVRFTNVRSDYEEDDE